MGWLIALAVLTGLAVLPLGISAIYDAGGAVARVIVGPIRFKIYPAGEKKTKKTKKEKPKKEKPSAGKSSAAAKKGGSITDFLPLVDIVLDFVRGFFRKLRVNRLELKVILAGDDPSDLGLNYGRAWSALGSLVPVLEENLVIKKRDMEVECDFTADTTTVYARADLTITLGRLLALVFRHGIHAVSEFFKINKTRKGGAVK